MAITATDIKFYLSGGGGNSDPNAALGGAISSTEIVDATLNNLYDNVSGDEASAGDTEYRAFFVKNTHGSLTWESVVVWISSNTSSTDTTLEIAKAGEGVASTIETVANESSAPVGETFSAPSSKGAGISLGNIAAGSAHGIWVKRIVSSSAAAFNTDTAVIRVEGDTAA